MKKKQTKTQRINALLAARPELTIKEVAKKLGVTPNLVHQARWKAKRNSEFVNKVFTKAGLKKQSKIMEAVRKTKAAMDALEKTPVETALELFKPTTVNFARRKDGAIIDLDRGGKAISAPDAVNHPAHYKAGGVETIDFIEAKDLNYRLGNVVKYVARAGRKATDPIEDLKKARWYLDREISVREKA